MTHTIHSRDIPQAAADNLAAAGIDPVLSRIYAARGITSPAELSNELADIIPPAQLLNADRAAAILADAIQAGAHMVVACDFDVDGTVSGSIVLRALRMMGAEYIDFAMPLRQTHGYGLSPLLVQDIAERFSPDLIITVDCGITSFDGVAEANDLGIDVLVTDHHGASPDGRLPDAVCIVNPNQPGDTFLSKSICGAGVAFYVMLALRAELRARGHFQAEGLQDPNLGVMLDMLALATVADVVRLDRNNRTLVHQGLQRIRAGRACAGIQALLRVSGKDFRSCTVYDLGFLLGPRLNAAGRLEDASLGVQCMTTDDEYAAQEMATRLDAINKERREVEAEMKEAAEVELGEVDVGSRFSIVMFNPDFHQGVVGILASRLKDAHGRPTIVFARGDGGKLKGSGRSIPGLHLRDAIDMVAKRHPGMLPTYGGHPMAAGMTLMEDRFAEFVEAFEKVVREVLDESDLEQVIETDGSLPGIDISLGLVEKIEGAVWGQGFPVPAFDDVFTVVGQRILKGKHLKLKLARGSDQWDAIWFFRNEELPLQARLVYTLGINDFNGQRTVQMLVRHAAPA